MTSFPVSGGSHKYTITIIFCSTHLTSCCVPVGLHKHTRTTIFYSTHMTSFPVSGGSHKYTRTYCLLQYSCDIIPCFRWIAQVHQNVPPATVLMWHHSVFPGRSQEFTRTIFCSTHVTSFLFQLNCTSTPELPSSTVLMWHHSVSGGSHKYTRTTIFYSTHVISFSVPGASHKYTRTTIFYSTHVISFCFRWIAQVHQNYHLLQYSCDIILFQVDRTSTPELPSSTVLMWYHSVSGGSHKYTRTTIFYSTHVISFSVPGASHKYTRTTIFYSTHVISFCFRWIAQVHQNYHLLQYSCDIILCSRWITQVHQNELSAAVLT